MNTKKKPRHQHREARGLTVRGNPRDWKRPTLIVTLLLIIGCAVYRLAGQIAGDTDYRTARHALARRDFQSASLHLQKYLNTNPNDAEALLLAAQTARRQRNFKSAKRLLQDYEEQHGNNAEWDLEQRLLRLQNGDLEESEAFWAYCVEHPQDPETAQILEVFIVGNLKALEPAFAMGQTVAGGSAVPHVARLREAVDLWLRQRPRQVDQVQGLVWRSQVNTLANDYSNAVSDVQTALKLDPNDFQALLQLAMTTTQDAPKTAVIQLEHLRQREPFDNQVRFVLASVYRSLGRLEEARKILDEMLASNPDQFAILSERGKLSIDMENPREAERFLRRAVELAPNDPGIRLSLSRCLRLAGKGSDADLEHDKFRNLIEPPNARGRSVQNE